MSRRLSGEASPSEAEELQQLLEQSPDQHYLLDILHAYFTVPPRNAAVPEPSDLEDRWQRIVAPGLQHDIIAQHTPDADSFPSPLTSAPPAPPESMPPAFPVSPISPDENGTRIIRWSLRKKIAYAAAAAAVILLGWGLFNLRPGTPGPLKSAKGGEVLTRAGARTKLVLPDGTQVWLNSSSRIRYTHNFASASGKVADASGKTAGNPGETTDASEDGASREVELEGEAYFDVAKDPDHPFIVHTSAIDVKVLGTAFTVKSYPQDETIETTLLRGVIEVSRKDNPNTPRVILKPNEKLVFNKHLTLSLQPARLRDSTTSRPSPAPPDIAVNTISQNVPDSEKVETGWMYNRLVFNGDSFKELSEKMERWYNIRIIFKDQHLYSYRFGGSFTNETVQEALNALQLTADFTYKIKGNEIELYGK